MHGIRVAALAAVFAVAACLFQASGDPASAAPDAACRAGHLALVIGNARYPDTDVSREPEANAKAVAAAFEKLGFATTEAENLNRDAMRAALDAFAGKIKRDATAALFFSGYGIQAGGHTYLVPVDAAILSEQDVKTVGFDLDRVMADLAARGARLRIVIIDAARRNPFERRFRPGGPAGLAAITGTPGAVALYAVVPGATLDETGSAPGPMVKALVAAMERPDAMAEDTLRRTRQETARASHGVETPWLSSFLDQDVALAGKECGGTRPVVADTVPAKSAAPPSAPPQAAVQPAAPVEPQHVAVATAPPTEPAAVLVPAAPAPVVPAPVVPAPVVPAPVAASPASPAPAVPPPVVPAAAPPAAPNPPPRIADVAPTTPPAAAALPPTPAQAVADAVVSDPTALREVVDRLFDQGFDPGEPGSPGMVEAIRGYEQRVGLPVEGTPTMRVLASLRATPAPTPWGALAFAEKARRWGMAWGGTTRRDALAVAKKQCGSPDCSHSTSFAVHQCGAFALSTAGWSIMRRDDEAQARDAALDLCGRQGTTCRIVGAVCADGSGRVSALRNEHPDP